jgi:hypothetical protein
MLLCIFTSRGQIFTPNVFSFSGDAEDNITEGADTGDRDVADCDVEDDASVGIAGASLVRTRRLAPNHLSPRTSIRTLLFVAAANGTPGGTAERFLIRTKVMHPREDRMATESRMRSAVRGTPDAGDAEPPLASAAGP